jgi:conjugative transfer signal peptidase TraF
VLFGILSLHPTRPSFIWNFSPSVPQGLYALTNAPWNRNDLVAVTPSGEAGALLAEYGVLAPSRVLLKRVAGIPDDVVCRTSTSVTINGAPIATALPTTAGGRDLPVWSGCTRLPAGRVFLLADHPSSFDGRYFGPTPAADILGVSRAVWTSASFLEEAR